MKKIIKNIKDKTAKGTRKATKSMRDIATVVGRNKVKYILIVASAIILPAGIIFGPIAFAKELKKDKKRQAPKKEAPRNYWPSFFIFQNML